MPRTPAQLEEITVSAPFFVIRLLGLSFFFPALACSLLCIHFLFSVLCLHAKCRHCLFEKTQRMRWIGKRLHAIVLKRFQIRAQWDGVSVCRACVEEILCAESFLWRCVWVKLP